MNYCNILKTKHLYLKIPAAFLVALLLHVARGWQISGTGARGLGALAHVPAYLAWKLTLPLRRATHARGEWVRTARDEERP